MGVVAAILLVGCFVFHGKSHFKITSEEKRLLKTDFMFLRFFNSLGSYSVLGEILSHRSVTSSFFLEL